MVVIMLYISGIICETKKNKYKDRQKEYYIGSIIRIIVGNVQHFWIDEILNGIARGLKLYK